jgi:hypothetical protein
MRRIIAGRCFPGRVRGGFSLACALPRRKHPGSLPGWQKERCCAPVIGVKTWGLGAVLLLWVATGCRSVAPLPPANLKEPGWTVRTGQAVWHLPQGGREIAGEVLVATRPDGRDVVQFTKSPFPLVTAQASADRWEVTFPPQNKHYSGRGAPPKRLLWLYLPRVLSGKPPPEGITWRMEANGWHLENRATGEFLDGYFSDGA